MVSRSKICMVRFQRFQLPNRRKISIENNNYNNVTTVILKVTIRTMSIATTTKMNVMKRKKG